MLPAARSFSLTIATVAIAAATVRPHGTGGNRGHWTRLAAGQSHACAITDDGRASCWGANFSGQVGDGTLGGTRSSPVAVLNLPAVVSISAGDSHTCALTYNSTVSCWGSNSRGQLGNTGGPGAVGVQGLDPDVVAVAAMGERSCAIRVGGSVWCWGNIPTSATANGVGFQVVNTPTKVSGLFGAVAVAGSFAHTCALQGDGTVMCWGVNTSGELGDGSSVLFSSSPVQVGPFVGAAGARPVDLSAGRGYTCVRLSDGTVNCWGANDVGQFGNGASGQISNKPVATLTLAGPVVALSANDGHTCAMQVGGTVQCWGSDVSGELGDGRTNTNNPSPGAPVANVGNAFDIEAGSLFTCISRADGSVQCWGDNSSGEHGDGNTSPHPLPDSVSGISGTVSARAVTAGSEFTCAIRGTGAAACWGSNDSGQLGHPSSLFSLSAVAVNNVANVIGISAGDRHACAVDPAGNAQCWGDGSSGQLGNGTFAVGSPNSTAVTVVSSFSFTSVSSGFKHSCGVTAGFGLVRCWGANGRGQLGTGDLNSSSVSVQTFGIANVVAVAAGNDFTCALTAGGLVACWGDNSTNQLGDFGTEAFSLTPKVVPGLANIVGIAAGKQHACALFATGIVACWGDNSRGQIGNNSTQPAIVQTGTGITDGIGVSAGSLYTCASRTFGGASCWGSNSVGELAAKDGLDHLTPTTVISHFTTVNGVSIPIPLGLVTAITTGKQVLSRDQQHTCTLQITGGILCWGGNDDGQIGDGTSANQPRPTIVNSFTANVDGAVTLRSSGRIATVTALINCPTGAEAHLTLTLTQGEVSGTGRAVVSCADRLLREPMTVPALGPPGFNAGGAVATVEALVLDRGAVVEDQHWTKAVTLSAQQ